jgi:hypothetical protein
VPVETLLKLAFYKNHKDTPCLTCKTEQPVKPDKQEQIIKNKEKVLGDQTSWKQHN